MKLYLLYFLIISLGYSCSNGRKNDTNNSKNVEDSALKVTSSSTIEIKSLSDTLGNSFQKFWLTFREAVIENDTLEIAELTRFPFETRGEMDSDPIVKYDRTNFFKVFKAYLGQEIYWNEDEGFISSLEEIKRRTFIDSANVHENWTRVGHLEFEKIDGNWKLVFAYLQIRDEDLWKR